MEYMQLVISCKLYGNQADGVYVVNAWALRSRDAGVIKFVPWIKYISNWKSRLVYNAVLSWNGMHLNIPTIGCRTLCLGRQFLWTVARSLGNSLDIWQWWHKQNLPGLFKAWPMIVALIPVYVILISSQSHHLSGQNCMHKITDKLTQLPTLIRWEFHKSWTSCHEIWVRLRKLLKFGVCKISFEMTMIQTRFKSNYAHRLSHTLSLYICVYIYIYIHILFALSLARSLAFSLALSCGRVWLYNM